MRAQRELDGPPLPEGCALLWAAFLDLDRWRGAGGLGPSPLTLADLAHYEARVGIGFGAEELDLLKRLDAERLAALRPPTTPTSPPR